MTDEFKMKIFTALAESLDIPEAAYEEARRRYEHIGKWLGDHVKAKCAQYKPHISSQGSFRLGTVTKPWKREGYDLDLSCNLREGVQKWTHSQEQLKELLGADLRDYRIEQGLAIEPERKHRCWSQDYPGQLNFHIDTVPCISESEGIRQALQERMVQARIPRALSRDVANLAVAITDDRKSNYRQISDDWLISNPEGYAIWFESRMKLAEPFLRSRIIQAKVARVEDLPVYRWKTPLQMAIQILKRHRDIMFERNSDGKPISIIITTLAAHAYNGELDILSTLEHVLDQMVVNPARPRVPNPVNPVEDFADKWETDKGHRLRLEENFLVWRDMARSDVNKLASAVDKKDLEQQLRNGFGTVLDERAMSAVMSVSPRIDVAPAVHTVRDAPPRPWSR